MADVARASRCPDCGTELTPDLPMGLCPKCLLGSKGKAAEPETRPPEPETGLSEPAAQVASSLGAAWRALSSDFRDDSGDAASDAGDWGDAGEEELRPPEIPRYRILRLIGAGGMGAVYEAEQLTPRRTVALKIVRPGRATRRLVRRFRDEAEALGRLQHPGIAQIYEFGMTESDGSSPPRPFFAMELVRGPGGAPAPTITEYARGQRLTVRQRLELVAQMADAVHYAHQKGIIHRDIKPANILLAESGQPKVLDFGVARVTDSDVRATTLVETGVGQIIGTLPYMSPEQAGGEVAQLDTRSDVYALGVVCYEVLTGRLPHDLGRLMLHEAVRVIREEEPVRLSTVDRALRGDVETIVSTALAKEKERRYASAAELAADIRRYLHDEPLSARKAGTGYHLAKLARRNKALVGGVAAVFVSLVLGLAATAWQAVQASRAREDARHRLRDSYVAQAGVLRWSNRPGRQSESLALLARAREIRDGPDLRNEAAAALASADLRRLRAWDAPAVILRFDGPMRRYAYHHGDGTIGVHGAEDDAQIASLPGAGEGAYSIRFSPDGRYLGSIDAAGTARVWDLSAPAGTGPVRLAEKAREGLPLLFGADSRTVAVASIDETSLQIFDLPGLRRRTVNFGGSPFEETWLSPDGRHVALCRAQPGAPTESVDVHGLVDGGEVVRLAHDTRVTNVAWDPSGLRIATAGSDAKLRIYDVREGVLHLTLAGHAGEINSVAYSQDGSMLASLSNDGTVRLWDPEGGELLARGDAEGGRIQFASDGRRIAFGGVAGASQRKEVWEVSPAALRVLRGGRYGVAFSHDGRVLAAAGADNDVTLWDARLGRRLTMLRPRVPFTTVRFPADGSALYAADAYTAFRYPLAFDAARGVLTLGTPRDVTAGQVLKIVAWSRNGPEFITPVGFEWPVTGPRPRMYEAATSPDGRWGAATLVANRRSDGQHPWWDPATKIHVWDRASGKLVASFPAPNRLSLKFSPDGRWLAAGAEGDARVWATDGWSLQYQVKRSMDGGELAFSDDGRVLAMPVSTHQVRLLEAGTWRELVTLESPHRRRPNGVAFSPDGARLAVTHVDNVVHLWDLGMLRRSLAPLELDWSAAPIPADMPGPARPVVVRLEAEVPLGVATSRGSIPPRDTAAAPNLIDLSRFYNLALSQSMHPLPNDTPKNDLSELPAGLATFDGTQFDVRGVVHLASKAPELKRFPVEATGIPVGQKCRRLHFLHGASWQDPPGMKVGNYRVHYADGKSEDVPVYYGRDVFDWWQVEQNVTDGRSKVAWRGGNPASRSAGKGLILFKLTWDNPWPEAEVVSVDFEAGMRHMSAPFLVAMTAEP